MLAILTSHPIQYQAPLWRALAESQTIKVWFLSDHGLRASRDVEFGRSFSWDVDLLSGYPYEFLPVEAGGDLHRFRGVRLRMPIDELLDRDRVTDLWIEGWRLKPMWDAVATARKRGLRVWMRGESNDLKRDPWWKKPLKRAVLGRHLGRVDQFLCIGSANRRLYRGYGIEAERLTSAPYCVDNDRFARQAAELEAMRNEIRKRWGVPSDAWCVAFCGKFISKKRPFDLIAAAKLLAAKWGRRRNLHLLMIGSGVLGNELRKGCSVVYDAEADRMSSSGRSEGPRASFVGFVNQSEIAEAYVAADAIALPSDFRETWGLVVNEAMACGRPAIVSDQCGCAEDLPAKLDPRLVFRCGDVRDFARALNDCADEGYLADTVERIADTHHLRHTVNTVCSIYQRFLPKNGQLQITNNCQPSVDRISRNEP